MGSYHLNPEERAEIIRLGRETFLTQKAIADAVGRSQRTVSGVLMKAKEDGLISSMPHEKRQTGMTQMASELCDFKKDSDQIVRDAGLSPVLARSYERLRDRARYKRVPFTLTAEEWGLLWEQSPADGPGKYLSRRKDIALGYSFDNMEIVSRSDFYETMPKGWGAWNKSKGKKPNGSEEPHRANKVATPRSKEIDRSPIDIIEKASASGTYFVARYETAAGQRFEGPFTSADDAMQTMMERRLK